MNVSSVINVPLCSFVQCIILEGEKCSVLVFRERAGSLRQRPLFRGEGNRHKKNEDALNAGGSY